MITDHNIVLNHFLCPGQKLYRQTSITRHLFSIRRLKAYLKTSGLWVGRSGQLTTSGSYITTDLINYPIIVVRDNSGNLKAFHNVCRHRQPK